jgi:carboxymethylenebutenolidase
VTEVELEAIAFDEGVEGMSIGLHGILGVPTGTGPWPGVVVAHEAFGIDAEMRKHVAHLAKLGYITAMPDLFSEGGMRKCIFATFRSLRSGTGRAFADIEAARQTLLARSDCTGAVGVIGFCMGGGFALMVAQRGFDVSSSNYGMLPKDLNSALEGACPIIGSYGGKDRTLKDAAAKLEAALTSKGIPHDIKEYPDAGHVFMNEVLNGPGWLGPIVRISNFGPNPEAAKDAWGRIEGFFNQYLKETSPRSTK